MADPCVYDILNRMGIRQCDFVYFNGPQIIFSWIQMFARYFVPYALMVGELDFTVKSEGSVSSWLH